MIYDAKVHLLSPFNYELKFVSNIIVKLHQVSEEVISLTEPFLSTEVLPVVFCLCFAIAVIS